MAEKVLFDAIERGDLRIVQDLLLADDLLEYDAWASSPDVNAPNENNDTPFALAVKAKDFDMAQLLLKCGAAVRSSLLTAVEMAFTPAVLLICDHLKEKKITLKATVDAFGEDKDHLTPTTPLMYAARHNYHDIVKILIEFGAEIPDLDVVLTRTQRDAYEDHQVHLYWYQAITSESYLLYATDDPMQATILAAKLLRKSKKTFLRHRKEECKELEDKLDGFLKKFVEMARNGEEIEDLIRTNRTTASNGKLPRRIGEALDLDFKTFISGQACRHFMAKQWYSTGAVLPVFSYVLLILLVAITQPILCIAYIILPFKRIRTLLNPPFIRFVLHCVSKLYFIAFLIYINALKHQKVTDEIERYCQMKQWFISYPHWTEYFFYAWLLGMTVQELKEMFKGGFKSYWKDTFNYGDVIQLVLYWASVGTFWASYVNQNTSQNLDLWNRYIFENTDGQASCIQDVTLDSLVYDSENNATRYENVDTSVVIDNAKELYQDQYNLLIMSDILFAIATVFAFLALFRDMTVVAFVGPLRISLGGMISDIIRFIILFSFVWLSFALGLRQLYHTYDFVTAANCHKLGECETSAFNSLPSALENLFWSMFNPLDPSSLRVNPNMRLIGDIGEVIYAIYMVVVVVVMLNALIAMMSNTYDRVKEHTTTEWTVERTKLMATYMTETATLPPPFNIIPTVHTLIQCICWPCRRTRSQSKRQKLEEVEMRSSLGRHNRSYQTFVQQITARYATAYFKPTDDGSREGNEVKHIQSGLDKLTESMQTMQTEVMKNQQMLLEILKRREADGGRKASWSIKKPRPSSLLLKSP